MLSTAAKKHKDSLELILCYGDALAQRGDLGKALETFNRASKLDEACPLPYVYAARSLISVKEYKMAKVHLDKASSIDPSFSVCYVERGQLFLQQEMHQKSLEYFQKALEFAHYLPEIRDILLSKKLAEILYSAR